MKALFCKVCGTQLTRALEIRSGKDPSVTAPELRDQEPIMPAGAAFKSYEPIVRSYSDTPARLEFAPQYWLNPEDLIPSTLLTKSRRAGGCCGMSGIDGPNQACRCGAEAGTLRTDCWTPLMFIPEPETTEWRPAP